MSPSREGAERVTGSLDGAGEALDAELPWGNLFSKDLALEFAEVAGLRSLQPLELDNRKRSVFGGGPRRDDSDLNLIPDLGNLQAGRGLGGLDVGSQRVGTFSAREEAAEGQECGQHG